MTFRTLVKRGVFHIAKWCGLFYVARRATRNGLRIFGYHGFASGDESKFRPALFMEMATFRKRMQYLKAHNYPVVKLEDACRELGAGTLAANAVVLTVDDGFSNTLRLAESVLAEYGFPATVYVTSNYSAEEKPVFDLMVQYIFWKAGSKRFDVRGLGLPPHLNEIPTKPEGDRDSRMWEIIRWGESYGCEAERVELSKKFAQRAGVDYEGCGAERNDEPDDREGDR